MTLAHICANARGLVDPELQGKASLDECLAPATLKNRYQPESYISQTINYVSRWNPWSNTTPLNPCTIQEKERYPLEFIDDFCPGCYYWQEKGYPKAPWAASSRDTNYLGVSPPTKYETNVWNTFAGCWVPKGGDITSSKSSSLAERVVQADIEHRKNTERDYRKRMFGTWQVTRYPHNDLPYDEWVDDTEDLDAEFKDFKVKTTQERLKTRPWPMTEQEKNYFEPYRSGWSWMTKTEAEKAQESLWSRRWS